MNHWIHTKLIGVLSLSLVTGGCSLLPFGLGGGGSSEAPRALRPEIHEVAANPKSDCLAQDEIATAKEKLADRAQPADSRQAAINAPLTLDAKVCTACGCKAEAHAAVPADSASTSEMAPAGPAGFVAAAAGEDELQSLMDGNKRFVEGELENAYQWPTRPTGAERANRRPPAAMILACSDWQTIPEAAFDAPPGELFVVRVAGNVADDAVLQSAKHAIERYDIPLIMVLGHESCGAVGHDHGGMTLEMDAAEGRPASHSIGAADESDMADAPIHANIGDAVQNLRRADAELGGRVADGRLRIVGAYYDETNGQITLEPDEALALPEAEYVALPRD